MSKYNLFSPRHRAETSESRKKNKTFHEEREGLLADEKRSSWHEVKTKDTDDSDSLIQKLRSAFCLGVSS